MAVYTQIFKAELENLLAQYDCGELVNFEGILQGVENTNYKIETTTDKFILTIFEKRTPEKDLPFFFDFMQHLHDHHIYCPFVIEDKNGERIHKIQNKSAALFSFLEGNNIDAADITPQKCAETGDLLARIHTCSLDFPQIRENTMSLPAWKELYAKIASRADEIAPDLKALMGQEIERAETTLSLNLPKAVVHADLFPDNVFERNGRIEGLIDFYFSSTDYLLYDLCLTINAWCFDKGELIHERFDRFMDAYQASRPLSAAEEQSFSDMARMAALRILMTRSHDLLFHDPANLVKPKDPLEYKRILEFHGREKLIS